MIRHAVVRLSRIRASHNKYECSVIRWPVSEQQYCHHQPRYFSNTTQLNKKKEKKGKAAQSGNVSNSTAKAIEKAPIRGVAQTEAFDFTVMESTILKRIKQLTQQLADIKSGGGLNPAVLERIQFPPGKKQDYKVRLSDVAQVVERGRHINIILSSELLVKPAKTALLSANLSLNPVGPTEAAPTTLVVSMPPPTGESRQLALEAAQRLYNSTLDRIREARQHKHKELRAMELAKTVNPDDLQRAHKEMEQLVKKFVDQVKGMVETHKQIIAR